MLQAVMRLGFLTICALGGFLPDRLASASEITGLPSTKLECLIVPKARIALPLAGASSGLTSSQSTLNAANYGQEIADGTSNVFVLRKYYDRGTGPDAGVFTKLTLVLKSTEVHLSDGQTKSYDVASGFYVEGGVGYVDDGEYRRARNPVSQISIARGSEGLTASLHATFTAEHARSSEKKEIVLDLKCPVRMASVKELGPWEGKVGTDWESFAPAK